MIAAEARRAVPMKLQRDLALALCAELMRELGRAPGDVVVTFELDHDPALCLRPIDPATGHHVPHQHDPAGLIWRTKEAHAVKTNGRGGERRVTTLDSDAHARAHGNRLTRQQAEFRQALLRKDAGEPKPPSRWPSRKLQSRNTLKRKRDDAHR